MSEKGLAQAEQRVREMNRVTRQYAEQGNRFMQQQMLGTQNARNPQNPQNNQTRFERVVPESNTYGGRQNVPKQNGAPQRPSDIPAPAPPEPAAKEREPHREPQPFGSAFQFDNEKLMILLILYLLIKEKADIKLILALGYLLL